MAEISAAKNSLPKSPTELEHNITYNIKLYLNSNFRVANKLISSS